MFELRFMLQQEGNGSCEGGCEISCKESCEKGMYGAEKSEDPCAVSCASGCKESLAFVEHFTDWLEGIFG